MREVGRQVRKGSSGRLGGLTGQEGSVGIFLFPSPTESPLHKVSSEPPVRSTAQDAETYS